MPDILSEEHSLDPWANLGTMRDHYPVAWHEPSQTMLVSRYEDVRGVLRDNNRFNTEMYKDSVSIVYSREPSFPEMSGKEHTAHRSLLSPFLHGGGLGRFTATIEERADALLQPLFERKRKEAAESPDGRATIDVVQDFSAQYPVDIIAQMMDLPTRDYDRFRSWYRGIIRFIENIGGDEQKQREGLEARDDWGDYILPLIAERRKTPGGEDLISLLCEAEVQDLRLSDEQIRGVLTAMLVAGSETTDHQVAEVLFNLIQHPEQMRAVEADRGLLDAAQAETLRYSSLVQFIHRKAAEDVTIRGVEIPKGTVLTMLLGAANRDPDRWSEPDVFNIFREDHNVARAFSGGAEHVGFGGGRHYCVGAQLSRQEVDIAMNRLLDEMTDIKLADGFDPIHEGQHIRFLPSLKISYVPRDK